MRDSIKTSPPHSLILVEDVVGGEIPLSMGNSLVSSTESCVAIGCLQEDDGETEIFLQASSCEAVEGVVVFDGYLQTPSGRVAVRTVYGDVLLEAAAVVGSVRLTVWANHPVEPDRIFVCFAAAR